VTVLTVDGRLVKTLADRNFGTGGHAVRWDGRDQTGRPVASGTYLYAVEVEGAPLFGRMTLLK
jgi:flagellar hook assembly protein FlgD